MPSFNWSRRILVAFCLLAAITATVATDQGRQSSESASKAGAQLSKNTESFREIRRRLFEDAAIANAGQTTRAPTKHPSRAATIAPTKHPSISTLAPTKHPSRGPGSNAPTNQPTRRTTQAPTRRTTKAPVTTPTPTKHPSTKFPTKRPTNMPTTRPPTNDPTTRPPTARPTPRPPTKFPTTRPPTLRPSIQCPEDHCGPATCMPSGSICCNPKVGTYCFVGACLLVRGTSWDCCAFGICNGKCCPCDSSYQKQCGTECIPLADTCCTKNSDCPANNVCAINAGQGAGTSNICQDCGSRGVCGDTCCACDGKSTAVTAPICADSVPQCCMNQETHQWGCVPLLATCCSDGSSCNSNPGSNCCTTGRR